MILEINNLVIGRLLRTSNRLYTTVSIPRDTRKFTSKGPAHPRLLLLRVQTTAQAIDLVDMCSRINITFQKKILENWAHAKLFIFNKFLKPISDDS